eukprot:GDKK01043718.1.p1 GENE.GDKK01043718.1~~GDKK01043718.1.p1  ORF type:complete len:136 (+),score=0.37 GDKK01043718.1:176-583(+)
MLCGTESQGARTPTQYIVQSILRKEAQQGKEKTSEQQEQKQQKSTFFLCAHAHSLHIYAYIVQITMFGKYASKKRNTTIRELSVARVPAHHTRKGYMDVWMKYKVLLYTLFTQIQQRDIPLCSPSTAEAQATLNK